MVNKLVLEKYDIKQEEIEKELGEILGSGSLENIEAAFDPSIKKIDNWYVIFL